MGSGWSFREKIGELASDAMGHVAHMRQRNTIERSEEIYVHHRIMRRSGYFDTLPECAAALFGADDPQGKKICAMYETAQIDSGSCRIIAVDHVQYRVARLKGKYEICEYAADKNVCFNDIDAFEKYIHAHPID